MKSAFKVIFLSLIFILSLSASLSLKLRANAARMATHTVAKQEVLNSSSNSVNESTPTGNISQSNIHL